MRITPLGWLNFAAAAGVFLVSYPARDWPAQWTVRKFFGNALTSAETWTYWPREVDIARLASDPSDVQVIGRTIYPGGAAPTQKDVDRIRYRPDGSRRVVLAYLQVGETDASDRTDANHGTERETVTSSDWLAAENCAIGKIYRVRFWRDGWKDRLYRGPDSRLRGIVAAGFDGVYLGNVDTYRMVEDERPMADREMAELIADLAATARKIKSDFLIVPEGGEALLASSDYRLAIDGFSKKGSLATLANADAAKSIRLLQWLRREGKAVFVRADPTREVDLYDEYSMLQRLGFVANFEADAGSKSESAGCAPGTYW